MPADMHDVFLSHNSQDKGFIEKIARRLRDEAKLQPFLDSWDLIPGKEFAPALKEAAGKSRTMAIFVGTLGLGAWQEKEVQQALVRVINEWQEYRIIPVLLPGTVPEALDSFLAQRTYVDFRMGFDDPEAFKRLEAAIKGLAPVDSFIRLQPSMEPYRGLRPFEEEHSSFFFGRDQDIQELLTQLQQHRIAVVVGASGAGKSSLVLGGVLPRLISSAKKIGTSLRVEKMTPGSEPLQVLSERIKALVPPAVLVVDQLEELFTHARGEALPDDAISAFVSTLWDAVEQGVDGIQVIATLRADFYERSLDVPPLRKLLQHHQWLLGSLEREALVDVIIRPAHAVGAEWENGLVDVILLDLSTPYGSGMLPLLGDVLYALWQARQGAWLTLSAYKAIGGVSAALRKRAQDCYEKLTPAEQEIAREIFIRLTVLGVNTPDTRLRVARSQLLSLEIAPSEQIARVLEILSGAEARLIVAGQNTVEVAHEILIREWPTLRGWLDHGRARLISLNRLTEAVVAWAEHGRNPGDLYTGSRLAEAQEFFGGDPRALSRDEREFLNASASRAEEEKRREAERKTLQSSASARALVTKALLLRKEDPRRMFRSIEEAWKIALSEDDRKDIQEALSTWSQEPGLAVLRGHQGIVRMASFSPDGARIVTAAHDGTARIWDARSGEPLKMLSGHSGVVRIAKFAASESSRLITAGTDGIIYLWDADHGERLGPPLVHPAEVAMADLSPDGASVVTACRDHKVRLWEVPSGRLLATLIHHVSPVHVVGFSADGRRLLTACRGGVVCLWDFATQNILQLLPNPGISVEDARLSPDGSRAVVAYQDGTVRLWDVVSGAWVGSPLEHPSPVYTAAFSRDGAWVVTACWDGVARVWDASTGRFRVALAGHSDEVRTAEFSPDGTRIVTASSDRTARIWRSDSGVLLTTLSGHSEPVWAATFSPDGTRIVTASYDGTARLWNAGNDKTSALLLGHSASVEDAVFSPHGAFLVTTSLDRTARVWEASSGQFLRTLSGHSGIVWSADFSHPDGALLVTASSDGTARVWEVASGRLLHILAGHSGVVWTAKFNPSNREQVVTASSDGTARLWSSTSGEPLAILQAHTGDVRNAEFSPDGLSIVTASHDGRAFLWDTSSGAYRALSAQGGRVWIARFSPDGSRVVTVGEDSTACLWDAVSGELVRTFSGHSSAIQMAAFSPDGSRIVTASHDGSARIWNADTGEPLLVLPQSILASFAAFSPDGAYVATASHTGLAHIWDAASGTRLAALIGHAEAVRSAVFSPDGSRVVTVSQDQTARLWSYWLWTPFESQLALGPDLEARPLPERRTIFDRLPTFVAANVHP